jgi:hypothetical protein
MSIVRRGAVRLAAAILLAQLAFFAVAAIAPAFCCPPMRAGSTLPECCRGEGHSCPLVKEAAQPKSGDALRACSRSDQHIAALLFDSTAVLVSVRATDVPLRLITFEEEAAAASGAFSAIESPPPRA